MPLTKKIATEQAFSSKSDVKDLLGLTPLPVDNRQRYLRFALLDKQTDRQTDKQADEQEALIPLSSILEVMQLAFEDILPVPDMPSCVLGVCGWQGETLWLVDLNYMVSDRPLLKQSRNITTPTVIVVQTQQKSLGLLVAGVSDIDLFDPSQLRMEKGLCPPSLEPYVLGYCPGQAGTVLDAAKIINSPRLKSR